MIQTTGEESSAVIQNRKICKVWVSRWRVKRFIDHSGSSETQGGRKEGWFVWGVTPNTQTNHAAVFCISLRQRMAFSHRVTTVEPWQDKSARNLLKVYDGDKEMGFVQGLQLVSKTNLKTQPQWHAKETGTTIKPLPHDIILLKQPKYCCFH